MGRTASTLAAEPEEIKRARESVSKSPLEAMRIANKYLQEDQSDFFAWRLRVEAADALGLRDEYLRSVQGAVRNLPEDMQTCYELAETLYFHSWNKIERRVAPLLKEVAEKAISLGSDYNVCWLALFPAYELLGDQEAAKEVSDKMHVLIEQGEGEKPNPPFALCWPKVNGSTSLFGISIGTPSSGSGTPARPVRKLLRSR